MEIACRGRQAFSKWIERVSAREAVDPIALLSTRAPELADADAALQVVRHELPSRFFCGVDDNATTTLRTRMPGEIDSIVSAADSLLEGRFDLLGYRKLWFGDPIDWHLDPVWSRRAPLEHWSRIDFLDPSVVGDSKIAWELNRHQWLVRLGQAWALTRDERYAAACVRAIDSWIVANPPGMGINWTSSLEVAYRMMSWCWTLLLIRESSSISGAWTTRLLAAIWQHANHVRRYLSYYFSPNTHLTGEALGLFYAGILFPEFHDARRWRALGQRILVAESQSQLSSDGVYFEQSTCYQRYTVETYLHFAILALRNGMEIPAEVTSRLQKMVEFLVAIRQPDGSIPAIGDEDGGALLPLSDRRARDARGVFAVAAAHFRREDFAWAAETVTPEVMWLMGAAGLQAFEATRPAAPAEGPSRVFPSGGYAVMRDTWDSNAHQLVVDVGPLGCHFSSGHGHADLLSIQCSAFGEPFLVDPGTYCYTAESQWRDHFRSTTAHSALLIDGQGQARSKGPFGWHQHPSVTLREWCSNSDYDLFDADHDAYLNLNDPVSCRRRVVFVKPHCWLIVDDLDGRAMHDIDLTFQFAPTRVALEPASWTRAESSSGRALWVSSYASSPIRPALHHGDLDPIRGWISDDYGQRRPAPMVTYSSTALLPWRALTVLLPDARALTTPPNVCPIFDHIGRPIGIELESFGKSVLFDDRSVLVS